MYSTPYSCQILMKLEFSQQIFEKYSNIKFNKNLSSGKRVAPFVRTDGQTDMTKLTVAFSPRLKTFQTKVGNLSEPNTAYSLRGFVRCHSG